MLKLKTFSRKSLIFLIGFTIHEIWPVSYFILIRAIRANSDLKTMGEDYKLAKCNSSKHFLEIKSNPKKMQILAEKMFAHQLLHIFKWNLTPLNLLSVCPSVRPAIWPAKSPSVSAEGCSPPQELERGPPPVDGLNF